jgi:hypothetical protein
MTAVIPASLTRRARTGARGGIAPKFGVTKCLGLAATPTFASMALLTGVLGDGPMDMLCSAGHGSALSGMLPMYLLMSMFHSSPWLELMSGRGRTVRRWP